MLFILQQNVIKDGQRVSFSSSPLYSNFHPVQEKTTLWVHPLKNGNVGKTITFQCIYGFDMLSPRINGLFGQFQSEGKTACQGGAGTLKNLEATHLLEIPASKVINVLSRLHVN